MDKDLTWEQVLEHIKESGVPYDPGFDTEELMVASFKSGIMLASQLMSSAGQDASADMLVIAANIKEDD